MPTQVISEPWAPEEGSSTVLLLSKHVSAVGSNQPATQAYACTTWREAKRLLNPRGKERKLQIQTILVFFVLKTGNLFM